MAARSVSPRLRRVLRKSLGTERAELWEKALAPKVDSVMGITALFGNGQCMALSVGIEEIDEATKLWEAADEEADAIAEATAKVRRVAKQHEPLKATTEMLAPPGTTLRKAGNSGRNSRAGRRRGQDAEEEADRDLEKALEEAYAWADAAGAASRRITTMRDAGLCNADVKSLLRNLFLHKVGVASTLINHLRNLARLRRWAEAKGLNMWTLSVTHLAFFLRDEGRTGKTVAAVLKSTLDWANFVLDLHWSLEDPLVVSVAGKDRREARAAREQATPYTKHVVDELLRFYEQAEGAEKFTTGFALLLAMAVLRFSDLDRTMDLSLNPDCLYGHTWRSKSKPEGMPWAMPRLTWTGFDIGGAHYAQTLVVFAGVQVRNWQWPAMNMMDDKLSFTDPVRHGSYGNCLRAHNLVLRKAGIQGDYTLHSPRFFAPGLAGQLGLTLEQRRALGHWGPNSQMPVRYDQARCCTELRMKAELWDSLHRGYIPAQDFRIPTTSEIQREAAAAVGMENPRDYGDQ